jgi:hypothetical protein
MTRTYSAALPIAFCGSAHPDRGELAGRRAQS